MTEVVVYTELAGSTSEVGRLRTSVRNRRLSTTFDYADTYLSRHGGYALEPALPLVRGPHHSAQGLPRALQDAAPDRWGRNLIAKRERALARREQRSARTLDDVDYLLGVSDQTRQGALRVAKTAGGEFEHPGTDVPKLVALPRLMRAAEEAGRDDPPEEALKALLDAGSGSLGGARPKASIADDERLLIAKFGHSADEWDVMRWEKIVLDLAEHAGIACPRSSLVEVSGRAVLLIERFDRETGHRIGYISALTLLEADDGETHDYLDVADALSTVSPQASADLAQLWARIAFSVAVHNTDDHLRNHGFLRAKNGWRLSPVFDVNPDPDQHSRRTTIAGATDPVDEARALLDCAPLFGLTPEHAHATITRVIEAVSSWRTRAHAHRVTDHEITRFAPVFTQGLDALATVL